MSMRYRAFAAVAFVVIVTMLMAVFVSCGKGQPRSTGAGWSEPTALSGAGSEAEPVTRTLAQVIAEIEAYEPPGDAGVDPDVFAMIRDELVRQIEARTAQTRERRFLGASGNPTVSSSFAPLKGRSLEIDSVSFDRLTSSVPMGDSGRVTDLAYDPDSDTLTWSYANVGDYDLSGEVGVPDITPIAQNYLADTTDGIGDDSYEAWVDGDGNGEVGISDITPIAENYLNDVMEYRIVTSDQQDSGFTVIGEAIPFGETGVFPKTYSVALPDGASAYIAVEPVGASLAAGERSDVISLMGEPIIASVEPTSGSELASATFSASVSGVEPFTYAWDFGGGATPDTSTESEPTVTLGLAGTYDASLTVTNDYGEDTFEFTLTVGEPPDITYVQPKSGAENSEVTLTATVTGTTPMSYSWDFGGGATPDTSTEESPTVTLDSAGMYLASLTITNDYGDDTFDFTLSVTKLVNENLVPVPQASPLVGDAPLTVTLFSNGSYNLTGEIVLYEWDFESDGVYDYSQALPYNVEHEYEGGTWRATLRITDENGATASARTYYIRVLVENPNWTFEKVLEDFDPTGSTDLWVVTLNINPETDLPVVTHYSDRKFGVIFKNEELEWETDIWYLTGGYSATDVSNAVIYEDSSIIQVVKTKGITAGDLLWVLRRYPDGVWDWWSVILESDFTTSKPRSKLALDSEGNIGLFYNYSSGIVTYALFDGENWNSELTEMQTSPSFAAFGYRSDIPWVVRAYTSLTIFEKHEDLWMPAVIGIPDPGDRFEYAFCSSSGETRYICASEVDSHKSWIWQNTGDLWLKEKLYDTDEKLIARPEAIASNENLVAVVLRIDTVPNQYVLAYKMSGDWQYELIRYDARLAIPNSMVVTDDNSIFLAYIDQNENELHVATRTPIGE